MLSSSDESRDEPLPDNDLARLRTVAQHLVDAIAAEPVPERLRALAIELGRALERQREKGTAGDTPPPA